MTTDDLIEEGEEKNRKKNVFNGLKAGCEDDVIMLITDVSKEQLEEYKKEFYKEN